MRVLEKGSGRCPGASCEVAVVGTRKGRRTAGGVWSILGVQASHVLNDPGFCTGKKLEPVPL